MRERNEFTTADYATHPKGGTAVRDRGDGYWPWKVSYHREVEGPWLSDTEMKQGGWKIERGSMSDVYDRACITCGHKINDHDANECWKTVDGKQCDCGWMVIGHDWSA